jgi:hypothetical protein
MPPNSPASQYPRPSVPTRRGCAAGYGVPGQEGVLNSPTAAVGAVFRVRRTGSQGVLICCVAVERAVGAAGRIRG